MLLCNLNDILIFSALDRPCIQWLLLISKVVFRSEVIRAHNVTTGNLNHQRSNLSIISIFYNSLHSPLFPNLLSIFSVFFHLIPVHASKQGNVIGLVSVYVCVCTKKLVTRDLIYLKFVATDFFL